MKCFKLSALIAATLLVLGFDAKAWDYRSGNFLGAGVTSVTVSNTLQLTNLQMSASGTISNSVGMVYTNGSGTQITVAAGNFVNLVQDVDFFQYMQQQLLPMEATNAQTGYLPMYVNAGIFIRIVGANAAANSAVNFVFEPIYDNEDNGPAILNVSETGCITVAVTASGTTEVRSYTPIDLANNRSWIGAKRVRLIRVNNTDTDATSQVTILECRLSGLVQ